MEVMKKKLCIMMSAMLLMLTGTVTTACSNDDGMNKIDEIATNETSTNPNERIVGSWLLVKENEDDRSSQNVVLTFFPDGTWSESNPLASTVIESKSQDQLDIKQLVSFEDGWAYDAYKDNISGYLALSSPSVMGFPYRFELKRKELLISFEPRGLVYIVAPTPRVYYYKRKY